LPSRGTRLGVEEQAQLQQMTWLQDRQGFVINVNGVQHQDPLLI
jgi:hypothetical protein